MNDAAETPPVAAETSPPPSDSTVKPAPAAVAPKLTPLKAPLSKNKPNNRRFSRTGLNLGITIDSGVPRSSPGSALASPDPNKLVTSPSFRAHQRFSASANSSPVISNGFSKNGGIPRSASVRHVQQNSVGGNNAAVQRSMSTSSSMKSISSVMSPTMKSPPIKSPPIISPPAAAVEEAASEITEKLRLLAAKEMAVVDLKDKIRKLTKVLESEVKELQVMRHDVQRQLYQNLSEEDGKESSRNRSNSLLGALKSSSMSMSSSSNSGGADSGDAKNDSNSPTNKRVSMMWSSISKPLNLFSQFDNMLQSEFEKISGSPSSPSKTSPSKTSPKKQSPKKSPETFTDLSDEEFFAWGDSTPSKPEKTNTSPVRSRKSSLVLEKGASKAKSSASKQSAKSPTGLKLSRNPSVRKKSININDHKIVLPKRSSVVSPKNSDFKGLFDDTVTSPNGINNPIIDLAENSRSLSPKDSNEVLQTFSSSLWNFYTDVKDGLMSIDEENATKKKYEHKNLSIDNLIDLDSSPEKFETPSGRRTR